MRTFYILAWLISATHKLESTVFLFALFFFLCELAILKILGTGKGFLPHTEYIAYNDFLKLSVHSESAVSSPPFIFGDSRPKNAVQPFCSLARCTKKTFLFMNCLEDGLTGIFPVVIHVQSTNMRRFSLISSSNSCNSTSEILSTILGINVFASSASPGHNVATMPR
jgi:hypothetical protein